MGNRDIVYGYSSLGLIFIPEDLAQRIVKLYDAAGNAEHHFDLYFMLPEGFKHSIELDHIKNSEISGEEFLPSRITTNVDPNHLFVRSKYQTLYPDIEMCSWMPQSIVAEYGIIGNYLEHEKNTEGTYLKFDKNMEPDIIKALIIKGYKCRADANLIKHACGSGDIRNKISDLFEKFMEEEKEEEENNWWESMEEYMDDPYDKVDEDFVDDHNDEEITIDDYEDDDLD